MKAALAIALLAVASCGRPPPARPAVPFDLPRGMPVDVALYGPDAGGPGMGLAGPLDVIRIARDGTWAVVCQSLFDTNMDGEIWGSCRTWAVRDDGGPRSDRRTTSLIVGSRPGVEIERLDAVSPDERYLVVVFEFSGYLVDTTAATATYLPFFVGEAAFTHDGRRLIYRTHEGLAVHELGEARAFLVAVEGPSHSIVDVERDGRHVRLAIAGTVVDGMIGSARRTERRFDIQDRSLVGAPHVVEFHHRLVLPQYVVPEVVGDRLVFATDDRGRRLVAKGTAEAPLGPLLWEDP